MNTIHHTNQSTEKEQIQLIARILGVNKRQKRKKNIKNYSLTIGAWLYRTPLGSCQGLIPLISLIPKKIPFLRKQSNNYAMSFHITGFIKKRCYEVNLTK